MGGCLPLADDLRPWGILNARRIFETGEDDGSADFAVDMGAGVLGDERKIATRGFCLRGAAGGLKGFVLPCGVWTVAEVEDPTLPRGTTPMGAECSSATAR